MICVDLDLPPPSAAAPRVSAAGGENAASGHFRDRDVRYRTPPAQIRTSGIPAYMLFALPMLMIALYFGGIGRNAEAIVKNILQYLMILAVIVLIKTTNPRVRIDQAVRFFWGPVTILAVISVALAYLGH